jgi:hypothetical protein
MSNHQQHLDQFKRFALEVIESHIPDPYISANNYSFTKLRSHWSDYGTQINLINKLIGDKAIEILNSASNDTSIDIINLKDEILGTALELINGFIAKYNPRSFNLSGKTKMIVPGQSS